MAKTKNEASKQKAWRFYRSNLSTIVWDPHNGKALADFSEGHFTTDNPKVARTLRELGYIEIPLDATEPPADIIISQPTQQINGDVPVIRSLMNKEIPPTEAVQKTAEANMKSRTKTVGGPPLQSGKKKSHGYTRLPVRRKRRKTA